MVTFLRNSSDFVCSILPRILGIAVCVAALGFASKPADASVCGSVTYAATQGGDFLSPTGCGVGNDEDAKGFGVLNGWTLGDSVGGGPGDGALSLIVTGQSWSITNTGGFTHLALALKQASSFAFYVLDVNDTLSGTWNTIGSNGRGNPIDDISHINAWYKGDGTPPPPPSNVPLPAAAWMLLAALGGLVLVRKQKA